MTGIMEPVKVLSATPTLDTNAYAAGDCMGTKMTFDLSSWRDRRGGLVQSVTLVDLAKQSIAHDLIVFDSDPSATTFTDNAALDIHDSDAAKVVAVIPIVTYVALNDSSIGYAANLARPFRLPLASDATLALYGILRSGGAPTYGASDITVRLGVIAL